MSWHENKRVLVGVSGGIAAYKTPTLVRRLIERGCEVRVMMSRAATEFITPLTMQAVSGHAVHQHLVQAEAESGMGHIELARWAEQIIIAPATANCIAKLVHGEADELLYAVVLASAADVEVAIAPAMNQQMWKNPTTQDNLAELKKRGMRILGPGSGDQACGETGFGRMLEPQDIAQQLVGDAPPRWLEGVKTLVTAGPTWEAIDPVRGLTNRSSGKMGYAVARAARDFGASVTLISGPVNLETPQQVKRIDVRSAEQMLEAVSSHAPKSQLFISVAAVADYRPSQVAPQKIKKSSSAKESESMTIELVKNPDILASVAALPNAPFTVGFAAETENEIANAREKLLAKGIDVIAVNHVPSTHDNSNTPFGSDENEITLLHKNNTDKETIKEITLKKTDKYRLAVQLIENIAPLLAQQKNSV